jgi:hypothetical protein
MKVLNAALLILAVVNINVLFAQPTQKELLEQPEIKFVDTVCGTGHQSDSVEMDKPWYRNNNYYLQVLKAYGFDLPEDYFDAVDDAGKYQGNILRIGNYMRREEQRPPPRKGQSEKSKVIGEHDIVENNYSQAMNLHGPMKFIPLQVWMHQNSSGVSPFTTQQLDVALSMVNELFRNNDVPIQFYVKCQITFLNNSSFNNVPSEAAKDAMFSAYYDVNAINLHLVASAYADGSASLPLGTNNLFIRNLNNDENNRGLLAHELGHCLGLRHTHNGPFPSCVTNSFWPAGNQNCNKCQQESVSRTNSQSIFCHNYGVKKCNANGDFLCDTPAEPNLIGTGAPHEGVSQNCQIVWNNISNTDNWNATWTPMQFNIMSYARARCRNLFSVGQIGRMLAHMPAFTNSSAGYVISGPTNVCNQTNYVYSTTSLSNVSFYQWDVPTGATIVSGQGTNTVTVNFQNAVGNNRKLTVSPNGCGFPPVSREINVHGQVFISGLMYVQQYSSEYYSATIIDNAYYTWSLPFNWSFQYGQGSPFVGVNTGAQGSYTLNLQVSGGGCTKFASMPVEVTSGGPIYIVSEDEPSTDNEPIEAQDLPLQIIILEPFTGRKTYANNEDDLNEKFSILNKGFYIVHRIYEKKIVSTKHIKQ